MTNISGPLTDLLQKLSSEDGVAWFLTLNRMLHDGVHTSFRSWKTVNLGTQRSGKELRDVLVGCGFKVDS